MDHNYAMTHGWGCLCWNFLGFYGKHKLTIEFIGQKVKSDLA